MKKNKKRRREDERERFVRSERERFIKQAINIVAIIFIHNSTRKSERRGEVREKHFLNKRSTLLQQFLSTTRRGKTKKEKGR